MCWFIIVVFIVFLCVCVYLCIDRCSSGWKKNRCWVSVGSRFYCRFCCCRCCSLWVRVRFSVLFCRVLLLVGNSSIGWNGLISCGVFICVFIYNRGVGCILCVLEVSCRVCISVWFL